jgi:hypothetical protein
MLHLHLSLKIPLASFRGSVQSSHADATSCKYCVRPIINPKHPRVHKVEEERKLKDKEGAYTIEAPDSMRICSCCGEIFCAGCCFEEVFELHSKSRKFVCIKCYESSPNILFSGQLIGILDGVETISSPCCTACGNKSAEVTNCPCCGKVTCKACISPKKVLDLTTLKKVSCCNACIETSKRISKQTRDVGDFEVKYNYMDDSFRNCSSCNSSLKGDFVKSCDGCFQPKCSKCCAQHIFNLKSNSRCRVCTTCFPALKQKDILNPSPSHNIGSKTLFERYTLNIPD